MRNTVSPTYIRALLKVARQPSLMLDRLIEHWPRLEQQIVEERRRLTAEIPNDDPIRATIDLLGPIRRPSDEVIHTQALAFLLNPYREHGFGTSVMVAMLSKLPRGQGVAQLVALLRQKRTRIQVIPEYRYSIEGVQGRSVARCDIWIELHNKNNVGLIVIENKIDAPEGAGQLGWYEAEAQKWCNRYAGRSVLLYLAPKKRAAKRRDDRWVSLSYLDMASALRTVWRHHESAPGRAWLGMYISTVTRGVLGMEIDRLQDATLKEIRTYLGEA